MSDIVKLNIRTKSLKAVVSEELNKTEGFRELPEVLEREKLEHTHKLELEHEFQKGYQLGKDDTVKELEKKHSEELLNQSKDFYNVISSLEKKFTQFENDFQKLVIHLSGKIAQKLLTEKMKTDSGIEKILDHNLKKIIGANDIIVKLNPGDLELLQKSNKEYLGGAGITKLKFESNENIQPGGCLVESEIGNIDARIESQISELLKALENHFLKDLTE